MSDESLRAIVRRLQLANHALKQVKALLPQALNDGYLDGLMLDMTIDQLKMTFEGIKVSAQYKRVMEQLGDESLDDRARQMNAYIEDKVVEIEEKLNKKPDPKEIN
jgi:hypothetical protein